MAFECVAMSYVCVTTALISESQWPSNHIHTSRQSYVHVAMALIYVAHLNHRRATYGSRVSHKRHARAIATYTHARNDSVLCDEGDVNVNDEFATRVYHEIDV